MTQIRSSRTNLLLASLLFIAFCTGFTAAAGTGGSSGNSIWGGSWDAYCYDRSFHGTWNASVSESNGIVSGNFYVWGGRECSSSISGIQAGDAVTWNITGTECIGNGSGSVSEGVSGEFVGIGSYCAGSFSGNCTSNCVNCPSDQIPCGSGCCESGQTCDNGTCRIITVTCEKGFSVCGSTCCNPGLVCISPGVCGCPSGQANCSGVCTYTRNDVSNCGSCGNKCPSGKICRSNECICPSDKVECESGCCSPSNPSSTQNKQTSANPLNNICFVGGIVAPLLVLLGGVAKLV